MGGVGTGQPQVWLRGEPASGRVRGLITARDGATAVRTAWVSTNGAYSDGRWHHLALRRGGGRLTLFVDGTTVGAPDVPGSVSRNSAFGVHIGQRMDGRAFFTGAVDEVRVWDRALTDAEITGGNAATSDTVLWLPMDRVSKSR
jgi:sialidase-1